MEIWKTIYGYEGYYEISNFGQVRSIDRVVTTSRGDRVYNGKVLKPDHDRRGYCITHLSMGGNVQTLQIHRLVAIAFIPHVIGKTIINHIDGNPSNNHVDNLEWCTHSENTQHAHDTGLITPCYGSNNPNSKLSEEEAREIIRLHTNTDMSMRGIAKLFPVSFTTVRKIINGTKWPHLQRPVIQ